MLTRLPQVRGPGGTQASKEKQQGLVASQRLLGSQGPQAVFPSLGGTRSTQGGHLSKNPPDTKDRPIGIPRPVGVQSRRQMDGARPPGCGSSTLKPPFLLRTALTQPHELAVAPDLWLPVPIP